MLASKHMQYDLISIFFDNDKLSFYCRCFVVFLCKIANFFSCEDQSLGSYFLISNASPIMIVRKNHYKVSLNKILTLCVWIF